MNILIPLGNFFNQAIGPLARKALGALGLGILSYGVVNLALQAAISFTRGYYDSLPVFVLNILGLAGAGQALGIVTGALVFRVSLNSMNKIGVLQK